TRIRTLALPFCEGSCVGCGTVVKENNTKLPEERDGIKGPVQFSRSGEQGERVPLRLTSPERGRAGHRSCKRTPATPGTRARRAPEGVSTLSRRGGAPVQMTRHPLIRMGGCDIDIKDWRLRGSDSQTGSGPPFSLSPVAIGIGIALL